MFSLLSLPRASWKALVGFFLCSSLVVLMMFQQWPHLRDDLALARWIAWLIFFGGLIYLPTLLMVVVFGRVPKPCQHMFKGLNWTLPQVHADFERAQRQQHERLRAL